MNTNVQVGFIGAGNMAQAVGRSIMDKGIISAKQVHVSAPSERCFSVWRKMGVNLTHNNHEIVLKSDIIFLAMKPQFLNQVLTELRSHLPANESKSSKLVISMLAGFTCEMLHATLKPVFLDYRLIRIIPNTALMVGEGFTGICPDTSASEDDIKIAKLFMSAGGVYEIVPENLIYGFGALAGCGIAFIFQIMEALSDGAVKLGVPRAISYKVAAQTLLGASKMVLDTNEHPAVLKDNVCSPGGTTICGVHALERGGLRATLMDAMEATVVRTVELEKKFKDVSSEK